MLNKTKQNGTIYTFKNIIGTNKKFVDIINYSNKIASKNSSVLILGDTGTGKELFAQSIHNASSFSNGPFIALNCAAIPDTLVESTLFGTNEGAFTGAKNTEGLLSQANNGTIFLDELNSMNLDAQSKLLRFLQDKTIRSVGGKIQKKISCRVICAVNKNIDDELKDKKIREDLYYRLSTITIELPPLVDRMDDIEVLSKFFISKYNQEFETNIEDLDEGLKSKLFTYNWPGNVRELEHLIENAMNIVDVEDKYLSYDHLSPYLKERISSNDSANFINSSNSNNDTLCLPTDKTLREILDFVERSVIVNKLRNNNGNISQTANDLGIFRQALQYRIKKYDINEDEYI